MFFIDINFTEVTLCPGVISWRVPSERVLDTVRECVYRLDTPRPGEVPSELGEPEERCHVGDLVVSVWTKDEEEGHTTVYVSVSDATAR